VVRLLHLNMRTSNGLQRSVEGLRIADWRSIRSFQIQPGCTAAEIRIRACVQEEEQGDEVDEVASRGGVQKYALYYTQLRTALRALGVRRDILHGQQ
jgi:hypothetical protein